jgi:uncharacterized protein YbdZ (MbtH family)
LADQQVDDGVVYRVVVNHEEQYSIWPEARELPLGWREAGKSGSKAECLAYIEEVWTDMRPLSLRQRMERLQGADPDASADEDAKSTDPRDNLVAWLSQGDHPVEAAALSAQHFLERIAAGHVNIRFADTRGGTELGISLTEGSGGPGASERAQKEGRALLTGTLTLNYQAVRLVAEVALDTLKGFGRLELSAHAS